MMKSLITLACILISASVLAASEGGHHEPKGIDMAFLFKEINFLILLGILYMLLRKPLREYFSNRAATLKLSVDQARLEYQEALKQHQEIFQRLKNIDEEGVRLMERMKDEGQGEAAYIENQSIDITRLISKNAEEIAQMEVKKAIEDLKSMTVGLSSDLARQSLKNTMQKGDQDRLAENFLVNLGKTRDEGLRKQ